MLSSIFGFFTPFSVWIQPLPQARWIPDFFEWRNLCQETCIRPGRNPTNRPSGCVCLPLQAPGSAVSLGDPRSPSAAFPCAPAIPPSACTRTADHDVPDSHKLKAVVGTFLTPLLSPFLKPMLSPFCRPAFHICPVCRASDIPEPFPSSDPPFSSLEVPPDLYPYAVIGNQARIAIADFRSIEFPQRFRTFPRLLSIV